MNVFDRPLALNYSSKLFAQKIVLTSENKRFIQIIQTKIIRIRKWKS